jgi:YD repeat-containing protein
MRVAFPAILIVLALAGCSQRSATAQYRGGQWRVAYDGFGRVAASSRAGARQVTLEPARPDSATTTHSALMLSAGSWRDFSLTVRVRTNYQLRQPHPNAWEVGWILWHYTNDHHFYYLILKPNGFELGKEDPSYPGDQHFLVTSAEPVFPVGRWYLVRVEQRGDVVSVSVAGRKIVRFVDSQRPYTSGRVGLYTEDASATFEPVELAPAP